MLSFERLKEDVYQEYEKKNHWSVSLRFVKKELALSNELLGKIGG